MSLSTVCVYCASNRDTPEPLKKIARQFGEFLAQSDIRLVYGGASIGMMGELADACIEKGGMVTGIIPEYLKQAEVVHPLLTELIVTKDMHERKMSMFDLSDAFVTLPGGLGTLEETLEVLTWKYLGMHNKPVIIANINGFYNHLLDQFEHCRTEGLIKKGVEKSWEVCSSVEELKNILSGM